MSSVFGFNEASSDMKNFLRKGQNIDRVVKKYADKTKDKAKKIAQARGLRVTGAGVEGIQVEEGSDEWKVGWVSRPNFHLYFHEIGFHALDNRYKKQRIKRIGKGRKRSYRGVKATYVAPTPHLRPAWDSLEGRFYSEVQQKLTD